MFVVVGFGDGSVVEYDGCGEVQCFFVGEVGDFEVFQCDVVLFGDGVYGKF